MTISDPTEVHPAWLPTEAFRALGSRRVLICGEGQLIETVAHEAEQACARYGGDWRRQSVAVPEADGGQYDLVFALTGSEPLPSAAAGVAEPGALGAEGFAITRQDGVTVVLADEPAGLVYGLFHVVRLGEAAFADSRPVERHRPAARLRMLDHWDNVDVHPGTGQVERGYSGGSIFWNDGALRSDLARVRDYGRLLAACGVNRVAINNVNVNATEAHLLTDRLGDVIAIADALRPYGIRVHLSVNFASPIALGGLSTADPLDAQVRSWWSETTRRVRPPTPP